jgi:uncharacterized repeat protein (TIGR01451 family)
MLNKLRRRFAPKANRRSLGLNSISRQTRRSRVENLEPRHLLTSGPTLQPIANQMLLAGAPLQIPLNATDSFGDTLTYTVSSSNAAISTPAVVTTNPDLVLNINHASSGPTDPAFSGTMTIELFENFAPNTVATIVNLTNQGFYNGTSFHRVVSGFVDQAGSTAQSATIDGEFSQDLRFSSPGDVGLALPAFAGSLSPGQYNHDGGSSDFFITLDAEPFLDFELPLFGRVVSDPNDLLHKINSVPVNGSTPVAPVTITTATITTDVNNLAFEISTSATSGSGTITVKATDKHGMSTQQTFSVTIAPNPTDPPPFIQSLPASPFLLNNGSPPTTTLNMPTTFQLPVFDLNGDPINYYNNTQLQSNFQITPPQPLNPNLIESISSTGLVTVTPPNGVVGVQPMFFGVTSPNATDYHDNNPDTQMVPLFIDPAAPTGISLLASSDTGASNSDDITSLNNANGHTLQFMVSGVTPGDRVDLYSGGVKIGSAVVSSSSSTVTVTTDGTHTLTDGSHFITAKQVLPNQSYTVGNSSGTVDLTSPATSVLTLKVDSAGPSISSVPVTVAQVNQPYNYTVQATDSILTGLTYSLVNNPAGMSVDPSTGAVTWTPTLAQVGSQTVQIRATDVAGNTTDQTFSVNVTSGPQIIGVSSTVAANSAFDAGQTIPITVTFSSPVMVASGTPQLALNNAGVATYVSGSGTATLTFNYVTAAGQDTATLDYSSTGALGSGSILDASNNPALLTLPATGTDGLAALKIIIDTLPPSVTVTSLTTKNTTPTITGTVTDSSPSSGVASVVVVVNGQTIPATVNGTNWTANVSTALGDGTYDVQATAADKAGNQHTITATGALVVDTISPTVTDVTTTAAANSTFILGQTVTINVSFSENVLVTGTPSLLLNNTGTATYSSGSGTSTLSFVYTVAPGQGTSDLDYASVSALSLGTATISDAAGNAAVLALPTPGTDSLAVKNITINSPAIVSDLQVTISPLSATAITGGSVGFTITVTNLGPSGATGITITDTLPANITFGSQTQTSGPTISTGNSGNAITDTLASLASGASATFTVVADVNITAAAGTVISNSVSVSSTSLDTALANNTASASTTIVANNIMLTTDPFDSTKMELVVNGTVGNDNISFLPAAGGKVSVNMNGKVFGPFAATSRLIARGGAGNDVITVSPAITLPAFLYSGTGIDRLTGGGGQNVLVGGGGTVTMIGGPTRNVLIAGAGKATIYSSKLGVPVSANSGSMLIAGSTNFDQNDAALSAIMHEWGSSDIYATRISKIRNGQIGAGVTINASTVHPTTHVIDQLYASPGGYDWFLNYGLTSQMLGIDPHKKPLIQIN